jgi:hypothetical protein
LLEVGHGHVVIAVVVVGEHGTVPWIVVVFDLNVLAG